MAHRLSGESLRLFPDNLFPDHHSHTKQKVTGNFDSPGWLRAVCDDLLHFFWHIGLAHGRYAIKTRYVAAHQRESCVDQRQVQWMADEIVDQHSDPAHA